MGKSLHDNAKQDVINAAVKVFASYSKTIGTKAAGEVERVFQKSAYQGLTKEEKKAVIAEAFDCGWTAYGPTDPDLEIADVVRARFKVHSLKG